MHARNVRSRRMRRHTGVVAAVIVVAMALWAQPAIATAGEIDASFGVGGVRSTDFGGTYDWGYAATVQPDGEIVAAGVSNGAGTYDFALTRYRADGRAPLAAAPAPPHRPRLGGAPRFTGTTRRHRLSRSDRDEPGLSVGVIGHAGRWCATLRGAPGPEQ